MSKLERVAMCNRIIRIIASHGRRFFSEDADQPQMESPRISNFDLDQRGRIWFTDRYTGKRIYVAYEYWKRGFSEGGTLRALVNHMRDFIRDERKTIPYAAFGPWPKWVCNGDLWGYGEEMLVVRREIAELFNPPIKVRSQASQEP